jgi:hypothetical protein
MSKLGPHFMRGGDVIRWRGDATDGLPVIYKFDPMTLGMSLDVSQGALVVGKLDQQDGQLGITDWKALMKAGRTPKSAAQLRFDAQTRVPGPGGTTINRYTTNFRVDVWEDDNEVVPDTPDEAKWYSDYCIEMMRRYEAYGKRRANFSFAVGTPDIKRGSQHDIWPHLLPAIRYARDNGHYIALHEYMGFRPYYGVGWEQIDGNGNPKADYWHGRVKPDGSPDLSYPYGWTVLRYRYIWDTYLRPEGLNDTKLIITELGCDSVPSVTPNGMPTGTWREYISIWEGLRLDPYRQYADMLIWYDRMISKDGYVAGATVFTVGSVGVWAKWDIANTKVEQYLVEYIAAGQPPPTEPEEPEEPEKPMPTNLLPNGSFEEGWVNDPRWPSTTQEPKLWDVAWWTTLPNKIAPEWAYQACEGVHKSKALIPDHEEGDFFADDGGDWTYKVFGSHKAMWFSLTTKPALTLPEGKYRLSIRVYTDVYRKNENYEHFVKDFSNFDPRHAQISLMVNGTTIMPWRNLKPGTVEVITDDFDHAGGSAEIAISLRCNWPAPNNGFWLDGMTLIALPNTPPPPPPPPPQGKHTAVVVKLPQKATELMWMAAAQYAQKFSHTMTASVDDALAILGAGNQQSYVKLLWSSDAGHEDTVARVTAAGYRIEDVPLGNAPVATVFTSPVGDEGEREEGKLW